ncbi:crotonase [Pseudomonas taiwanensis]|uniref:enoyl-CoA hydratase-related protein n=1 Tax=Pseudomonas TaxID=286 RepID=UPI0015B959A2|nr:MULTISPECIES: enoyl-CoA hydratase-related protein [Pseudomonas]MDH4559753.1 crotonase [Pseudomonas sp. BN411]MDH4651380.1 crotonase [Pseudomonas sp. BN606]MDH4871061.1 crotonase [Pseudomonas sp. BN515]NWL77627.1 crotonase [Pseudomonas taiwanensis]
MSNVDFYIEGHTAHVRLNRPKSLNAINGDMDQALFEAWHEINNNPEVWVAVLSAEGDRAFCVGGDISGGTERVSRMAVGGGLTGIGGPLVKLKKPLVAAVQGYALGGGFELALCADIIVAADNAQFGLPETKAGIIGECGVVHRAIRQLPQRIAMAMILTGDRMSAQDAFSYGLVNEVVEPANLAEAAMRWAEKVAAASPLANQAAKDAAMSRLDYPLEVALATRFESIEEYASSEDVLEGRNAFVEKRKAEWKGR